MASHSVPFGQGFEMVALAQNLASHGTYANPFPVLATGPTAANPPLYPFLLAILFKLFRSENLVLLFATLANILANAVTAVLLPRISIIFYRDFRPGVAAAVLWILSCYLLPDWDVEFAIATLLIFCLVTAATMQRPRFAGYAALAGLLAGALLLFNPATVLIFVPWMVFLLYRNRSTSRQSALYACVVFAILIAAGSAWGFRNQRELGKFVMRTNFGTSIYTSNNDCASPSLLASEDSNCHQLHNPNTNISEALLLKQIGEVNYDRQRTNETKAWIRAHPEKFLRLTLARMLDFWFPVVGEHPFKAFVIWTATLLSLPGLLLMLKRRMDLAVFTLVVLLVYPLMYYIVVSDVRYRLPVLWLSLLPAGFFLVELWSRRRSSPA